VQLRNNKLFNIAVRKEVTVETYTSGYTEFNRLIIRIHMFRVFVFTKTEGKTEHPCFRLLSLESVSEMMPNQQGDAQFLEVFSSVMCNGHLT
jgi:hypothetical protein